MKAHRTGVEFVSRVLLETLDEPVDAVITTSAGYPLDLEPIYAGLLVSLAVYAAGWAARSRPHLDAAAEPSAWEGRGAWP